MPYRFLDNIATADVAFEAWDKSLEAIFTASAEALLQTMVDEPGRVRSQVELPIAVEQQDLELLLFGFLNELIYLKDTRRVLLHVPLVRVVDTEVGFALHGTARGEGIDPRRHRQRVDVKAATLHRLQVVRDGVLWRATAVLDV